MAMKDILAGMTSYEDGSFLIDRVAAGMVVDQDCAKSCQTVLPIPCADGHTPGATALGLLCLLIRWRTLRPSR